MEVGEGWVGWRQSWVVVEVLVKAEEGGGGKWVGWRPVQSGRGR